MLGGTLGLFRKRKNESVLKDCPTRKSQASHYACVFFIRFHDPIHLGPKWLILLNQKGRHPGSIVHFESGSMCFPTLTAISLQACLHLLIAGSYVASPFGDQQAASPTGPSVAHRSNESYCNGRMTELFAANLR